MKLGEFINSKEIPGLKVGVVICVLVVVVVVIALVRMLLNRFGPAN